MNFLDKSSIYFVYFFGLLDKVRCTHLTHNLSTSLSTYFNDFLLRFGIFAINSCFKMLFSGKNALKYLPSRLS